MTHRSPRGPRDPFDPRTLLDTPSRASVVYLDNFGCHTAKVSIEDYAWLCGWMWCAHFDQRGKLYARREMMVGGRKTPIYMHRAIMERVEPAPSPDHVYVDHLDGDGTNNQRSNLRWVTASENAKNVRGLSVRQLAMQWGLMT